MHSPFRFPYIATTCYDLDRDQHLLIIGEIVDGHVDDDSVECLRFDLREERDAKYDLLGGKEKEVNEPTLGPIVFIETEDDCPIERNYSESMNAIKRYVALVKDINDEFTKNAGSGNATFDATEVMRLSKIRDDLVKKHPGVRWFRALNKQAIEKLIDKHGSGDCTHKYVGSLESVKNPVRKREHESHE